MWILHQVRHRLSNCKTPESCQLKSGGCTNVTEYIDTTCSAAEEAAVTGCRCGLLQSVVGCDDQSLPDQQSSLDRCKERGCKLCKSHLPSDDPRHRQLCFPREYIIRYFHAYHACTVRCTSMLVQFNARPVCIRYVYIVHCTVQFTSSVHTIRVQFKAPR